MYESGSPIHDPTQTFSIHVPTSVDGMYYNNFVKGGKTETGAIEYVSKLDRTDAIDRLEILE